MLSSSISLAKGLEFDTVIVPDAQTEVYPATLLVRCCLYTAISRVMHKVTVVGQGTITELLAPLATQIQEV
ncbi:ATP-binding domain-containing protein [Atopobium sp. oral taxon 416]|nr:ATP-binding domain-containing protein [Atopobium sp. oral taxon 416]